MSKPTASLEGARLTQLSLHDVTLVFDVLVKNPYTVELPLVDVDYALASTGTSILQGKAALQGSIPAKGQKVLALPATVVFAEVLKVLSTVRPGALLPYRATLGLSVNIPHAGPLRLPLTQDGQFPIPAIPDVSVVSLRWQNVSLAGLSGIATLRVGNTNSFPIDLSSMDYGLQVGSFQIAKGGLDRAVALAAGQAHDMNISFGLSPARVGLAILDLARGASGNYSLAGNLTVGTPFGPLQLPLLTTGVVPFR